jgi:hypothetical protein
MNLTLSKVIGLSDCHKENTQTRPFNQRVEGPFPNQYTNIRAFRHGFSSRIPERRQLTLKGRGMTRDIIPSSETGSSTPGEDLTGSMSILTPI